MLALSQPLITSVCDIITEDIFTFVKDPHTQAEIVKFLIEKL